MDTVAFFLGAGASKDAGGPLVGDFVPAVLDAIRGGIVPRHAAEAFARLQEMAATARQNPEDIEKLLAHADTLPEHERRRMLREVSAAIGATLASRITFSFCGGHLTTRDLAYRRLAGLLRDLSDRRPGSVGVVTVNYDVCADVAIMDAARRSYYCLNRQRGPLLDEITLAKLHGSLNWFGCVGYKCPKGTINAKYHIHQYVAENSSNWSDTPEHVLGFPERTETCEGCGQPMQSPLIVPPIADKRAYGSDMQMIWDHAAGVLHAADMIALVGYSFGSTDDLVNRLIAGASSGKRLLVANPSEEARALARAKCPAARFLPDVGGLAQAVETVRAQVSA